MDRSTTTAWPLPPDVRDVILVGGTFDPPHRGHVAPAVAARDATAPHAWLVFIPAARSPHKDGTEVPAGDRVSMLRLATSGVTRCAVWTDEVDRARDPAHASYTIDTLERLGRVAPHVRPRLLIGADQALQFHRWKHAKQIVDLAGPIVLPRGPIHTPEALRAAMETTGAWSPDEASAWAGRLAAGSGRVDPASSTDIRRLIAERGVDGVPEGWLAPAVAAYIRSHRLYRGGA